MNTAARATGPSPRGRPVLVTDRAVRDMKALTRKERKKVVRVLMLMPPHLCKKLEPHGLALWACKVKDDLRAVFRIREDGSLLVLHVSQRNDDRVYQFLNSHRRAGEPAGTPIQEHALL
jgi:mRNA-degrading endonuclease RelE of RelBE toxin-antitoxin system